MTLAADVRAGLGAVSIAEPPRHLEPAGRNWTPMRLPGSAAPRLPRRIVLFTETFLPRVDGIVNALCWTLRGLVEAGCEPLVVAPRGNTTRLPGVRVLGATSVPFPLYPEVRLAVMGPGIGQHLDRFQPDVVHLVGPVVNGTSGLLYAQSRGLPVLASFHTNLAHYTRHYSLGWLEAWVWRALRTIHNRCSLTLCPSHAVLGELRARGFQRLRYWSRGVDTQQFSPVHASAEWRARLGVPPGVPVLLYVGRLAREKRVADLAPLMRSLGGAHLVLIGDGPARAELEQAFAGLPVSFTGYLRGPKLAEAYASADLFVFPSDSESFGNVVLEAMASGLPVVAPAAGGVSDLVQHGVTGQLFTPTDADDLLTAVRLYVRDAGARRQHGLAAREAAQARTWSRQQQLLLTHYAAVMHERRSTPR
ncbi:MAG: glycosyltransferase family 4 protein [Chloroflexota bacterium]